MKILFLAAYSKLAASSRTRVYDFFPLLKEKGITYDCICFIPEQLHHLTSHHAGLFLTLKYYVLVSSLKIVKTAQALVLAGRYDIVVIQKITFPAVVAKALKLLNKNIIFDFDDAIFTNEGDKESLSNKMRSYFQKKGFENMLSIAACCIVENEYNKKIALRHCPRVEIITGPIDTDRYFFKDKQSQDTFVIGWTGSASTQKYLYLIESALKELSQKYNILLKLSGVRKDFTIPGMSLHTEPWNLDSEVAFIQSFDIGIMPLPDNEWTRGKGGYKLLQYMAAGIPAVASPVEINNEIIKDGFNGFLAHTHEEWVGKISLLIKDVQLRKRMSQEARRTMEKRYSLRKGAAMLANIFNSLAG